MNSASGPSMWRRTVRALLLSAVILPGCAAVSYCNVPIADSLRRRVVTNLRQADLISPQEAADAISAPFGSMLIPREDCFVRDR